MPTPGPAIRTLRARPWPSAGPSTRAAMPGPVVSRTAPTPIPAGRTPAPSSSASSTSTPPSRRPAVPLTATRPDRTRTCVVADLEEQGEHDVGQGREPAMPGPELADLDAVTQSAARSRGRKYSAGRMWITLPARLP